MKTLNKLFTVAVAGLLTLSSCSTSDLEPSLEQEKTVEGSITDVSNLYGLMKGAYDRLQGAGYYGRDFIINGEVRTDNCFSNANSGRFTTQASFLYDENTGYMWDDAYRAIASANIIIGTDVETLTGDLDYGRHLQGQAYALRALCHFDLVKTYGQQHAGGTIGVPYVTEFKGEDLFPSRNSVEEVKAAVYADLNTAFSMMQDSYYDSTKQFISKYTAKAIESRVAVYFGDWNTARSASEAVMNSGIYSIASASSFASTWSSDSTANSIFELAYSAADRPGNGSLGFIYRGDTYGDVQVIDEVIDIFEDGDVRKDILGYENDVQLRNMLKYPSENGDENLPVFRYEEIILNYAEALLETGGNALAQVNALRAQRGVDPLASVDKDAIILERRKELMFEGFRFDDLMRTGQNIEKFSIQQNISETIPYGDFRLAWPIPAAELNANSNMVQNTGY